MNSPKNILVYCADHMRADFLACAGHPLINTPNLDRLARRGVRFERLYTQCTVCMPARASIMTGTYPCSHTVTDNGFDTPKDCTTIADVLAGQGYHTMAVGRTHLVCTQPRPEYPRSGFYGFQECSHAQVYCGDTDPGNDYLKWIEEEHPEYYEAVAFANRTPDPDLNGSRTTVPEELSMTSWITERSLEFIREHCKKTPEQPFFMWSGVWDPHSPYRAPEPWGSMYDPEKIPIAVKSEEELEFFPESVRRYAQTEWQRDKSITLEKAVRNSVAMFMGMVSHIDDQFGKLLDGLEELGIADDTIVLFTSDHGDMLGDHWFFGKRLFFYENVLKVPGIMAGPGIPQGLCINELSESVDLMPTLLDLAGVPVPLQVQGKSWQPFMNGNRLKLHDNVYTEIQAFGNLAGKDKDRELSEYACSIFNGRYRIVCFSGRDYGLLFDLEKDPGCLENMWDNTECTAIKIEMQNRLLYRLMSNMEKPDTRLADW